MDPVFSTNLQIRFKNSFFRQMCKKNVIYELFFLLDFPYLLPCLL